MFGLFKSRKTPEISCADAFAKAQRKQVHLIDVRELLEWQHAHVEGSIAMPLSSFDAAELPQDKPLVFLCLSGRRSATAAQQALAAGRTASNVTGGFTAWRRAGLPMRL